MSGNQTNTTDDLETPYTATQRRKEMLIELKNQAQLVRGGIDFCNAKCGDDLIAEMERATEEMRLLIPKVDPKGIAS